MSGKLHLISMKTADPVSLSDMPACRVLLPLKPNAVMHE